MVVRKKTSTQTSKGDSMDLAPELQRIKEVITHIPSDEGENMSEAPQENASTQSSNGSKKTPKKVTKKKVTNGAGNVTTLAEVAKPFKMEPRAARRVLRNAKVKNPGRWAWPKGSAELKKAQAALKASQAK